MVSRPDPWLIFFYRKSSCDPFIYLLRCGQQSPYFFHRQPVHAGILLGPFMLQASQIFYCPGIVPAMNALHFTPKAKHEIHLSVRHVQHVKIGPCGCISPAVKRIELLGILFIFFNSYNIICPGNIHHQYFVWFSSNDRCDQYNEHQDDCWDLNTLKAR